MKRILIPTDFSKISYNALKVACELAKKTDATLYLMHTIDLPIAYNQTGSTAETSPEGFIYLGAIKKRFAKLLKDKMFDQVRVMQIFEFSSSFDNLNDIAEKNEIDLILVGTSGASGSKELISGSNAEMIVKMAKCPVLSVKMNQKELNFENIVFASDFKAEIKSAFYEVKKLAEIFNSKLHLLYVNTPVNFSPNHKIESVLNEFVKQNALENYTVNVYSDYSEEEGIYNFAKSKNIEIVALGTHARKGLGQMLRGNLAANLVNHIEQAVISVRIA